jgi:hypothetical protein
MSRFVILSILIATGCGVEEAGSPRLATPEELAELGEPALAAPAPLTGSVEEIFSLQPSSSATPAAVTCVQLFYCEPCTPNGGYHDALYKECSDGSRVIIRRYCNRPCS